MHAPHWATTWKTLSLPIYFPKLRPPTTPPHPTPPHPDLSSNFFPSCLQPIGHGATISAPHMHAHALEELQDKLVPGARFLDVGSGTGVLLAAAARLVSPGGKVFGVEHIPELVEMSRGNLQKDPQTAAWLADNTINVEVGDGYVGLPQHGPFDAIHVGAAPETVPQALLDQLALGGKLVLPVGRVMQEFTAIEKDAVGKLSRRTICGVSYVPLTSREKQEAKAAGSGWL
jgi:protein-L-isoaspartate(D-aspartate) O-methyltransferase